MPTQMAIGSRKWTGLWLNAIGKRSGATQGQGSVQAVGARCSAQGGVPMRRVDGALDAAMFLGSRPYLRGSALGMGGAFACGGSMVTRRVVSMDVAGPGGDKAGTRCSTTSSLSKLDRPTQVSV